MEQQMIANGGLQYVPQVAVQYVYLDFDGELTSYDGEILTVENVEVQDSSLTEERIANIVAELNAKYAAQNVIFVTQRPGTAEYSTIYIGKTEAFSLHGNFAGLAETIDSGNKNKTDKAFVMLNATNSNEEIINTISHETDHLLGTLNHGGEGINAYASDDEEEKYYTYYHRNQTYTGGTISSLVLSHYSDDLEKYLNSANQDIHYYSYDSAYNVLIWGARGARCNIYSGGFGENLTVSGQKATESSFYPGNIFVYNGGSAHGSIMKSGGGLILDGGEANYNKIYSGGWLTISHGKTSDTTVNSGGRMWISIGGVANSTTVNSDGGITIGGVANSTTVNSDGFMYISIGGVANSTTVNGRGSIYIESGGVANSTTVNSGGNMRIFSGGVANSTTVNSYGRMYIYSGGGATEIVENGGYVYVADGANVTFTSNTINGFTLSGGSMTVHSNTVAKSTTVNSGGSMFIYSGGVANSTTVNSGGNMRISSGGVHSGVLNIEAGGIVYAYSGSIISIDLTDRSEASPAVINNITRINGSPTYTVSIDSDLPRGKYKLAGNAANCHKNITLTVNGNNAGVFQWSNGAYNSVKVGNDYYTLVLDQASNLCLQTVPRISIDYSINEIDQIVYYQGPRENEFDGVVMKVPYSATATITLDKDTPDGEYEFVTVLDGIDGAEQKFKIQVIDGMPVYLSSNACYYGTKLSETAENSTWTIKVNDFVLTEKIQNDMILSNEYIENGAIVGSTNLSCNNESGKIYIASQNESDANKEGYYIEFNNSDSDNFKNGNEPSISIMPLDTDDDYFYDCYEVSVNGKIIDYLPIKKYLNSTDMQKISLGTATLSVPATAYSLKQEMHCWIAVATNMLYKGGFLTISAQKCFDYLSDQYFTKDNNKSIMESVDRVLKDLGIRGVYENWKNNIFDALKHMEENPDVIGAIILVGHGLTCYKVDTKCMSVVIADSDRDINEKTLRVHKIYSDNGFYYLEGYGKIESIETFLPSTTPQKIGYKDLTTIALSKGILAQNAVGFLNMDAITVVNGSIEEAIVEADGILEIADGATGDTIILHDKAALNLKSGAVVRGEIMTHGGTISTESGVLFEEAEINFVISMLDGKKEAILDDLGNVGNMPLNVTVMAHQSNGEYILADGADGFNGEITIHGEYGNSNQLKMGFEVGELGTLKAGEKLKNGDQVYSLDVENNQLIFRVSSAPLAVWNVFADITYLTESAVTVSAVFSDDITVKEYSLDGTDWKIYDSGVVISDNVTIWFRGADANGNYSDAISYDVNNIIKRHQGGTAAGLTMPTENGKYLVEYSKDNFNNYLQIFTTSNQLNTYGMANGCYNWQFWEQDTCEWGLGNDIVVTDSNSSAKTWLSNTDGNMDVFFANANGAWGSAYAAQHLGVLNGWSGTKEQVILYGKNKLADIFEGSSDANILVMTDDANGDALFVDDIFTSLPGTVAEQQARIAKIDEIRAGVGDDVVDLTSQRFAYIGDGVKIYGGLGNDTIWANNGNNTLFGDAGNDRLVGGSDDDVIIGGSGNDSLHGGGGDDIFCFGENWGQDTVEQLVDGKVTLWFESGSASNWNADTLTYTDATNSVKVSGISADNISLKFGGDTSVLTVGCFDDAASEKIFEDKNTGMLA